MEICNCNGWELLMFEVDYVFYPSARYLNLCLQDIWQWSELTSFGDLPSPRDFAAASSFGNRKIVMWVSIFAFFLSVNSLFLYDKFKYA